MGSILRARRVHGKQISCKVGHRRDVGCILCSIDICVHMTRVPNDMCFVSFQVKKWVHVLKKYIFYTIFFKQ